LPANSLAYDAAGLKIKAFGKNAANTNQRTITLWFGSPIDTTLITSTSGLEWMLSLAVMRTGPHAQIAFGTNVLSGRHTGIGNIVLGAEADDDPAGIPIYLTGQSSAGAPADVRLFGFSVFGRN
jgi:hypothetical protein